MLKTILPMDQTNGSASITDRELKISYWYVTNKLLLRKIIVGVMIFVCACFWIYIGWQMVFYAINGPIETKTIERLMFNGDWSLKSLESGVPTQLSYSKIQMLFGDSKRNDFLMQVSNSNSKWLATFDYQFISPDVETDIKKGFVLPGETKYLMDLGLETRDVQVSITNLNWQFYGKYDDTLNNRMRFSVSDEKYVPNIVSGGGNQAQFILENQSSYNYWEVGIQVFLYNRGDLRTINYITIDQLKTGEIRPIDLVWNEPLSSIDSLEVVLDLNILDEDNIMPQEGSGRSI